MWFGDAARGRQSQYGSGSDGGGSGGCATYGYAAGDAKGTSAAGTRHLHRQEQLHGRWYRQGRQQGRRQWRQRVGDGPPSAVPAVGGGGECGGGGGGVCDLLRGGGGRPSGGDRCTTTVRVIVLTADNPERIGRPPSGTVVIAATPTILAVAADNVNSDGSGGGSGSGSGCGSGNGARYRTHPVGHTASSPQCGSPPERLGHSPSGLVGAAITAGGRHGTPTAQVCWPATIHSRGGGNGGGGGIEDGWPRRGVAPAGTSRRGAGGDRLGGKWVASGDWRSAAGLYSSACQQPPPARLGGFAVAVSPLAATTAAKLWIASGRLLTAADAFAAAVRRSGGGRRRNGGGGGRRRDRDNDSGGLRSHRQDRRHIHRRRTRQSRHGGIGGSSNGGRQSERRAGMLLGSIMAAGGVTAPSAAGSPIASRVHEGSLHARPANDNGARLVVPSDSPCNWTYTGAPIRQVLQVNGSTEDIVQLMLCPPLPVNGTVYDIKNYTVAATSSASDVLDVARGDLDMTSTTTALATGASGYSCRNVSVVAAFDRFVGDTELTFTAEAPPVNATAGGLGSVCLVTVAFRVVGVTVYHAPEPPPVIMNKKSDSVGRFASVDSRGTTSGPSVPGGSGSGGHSIPSSAASGASGLPPPPPPPSPSPPPSLGSYRSRQPSGRVIFSGVNSDSAVIVPFASLEHAPVNEYAVRVQLPHDGPIHVLQGGGGGLAGGRREGPTVTGDNAATFSFRIALYHTGSVGVHLLWETLTVGWEAVFGGEVYENFVPIVVTGAPPPAVVRIDAPPLLRRQGGEEVVLSLLNMGSAVDTRLLVAGVAVPYPIVPGSLTQIPGTDLGEPVWTSTHLSTPGEGQLLNWTVEVEFGAPRKAEVVTAVDITDRFSDSGTPFEVTKTLLSYEGSPLTLRRVDPPYADAGAVISLDGYFHEGNNTDGIYVVLNGRTLPTAALLHKNTTNIQFVLPPRGEVGSAYDVDVQVLTNFERSNARPFRYVLHDFVAAIDVVGASLDASRSLYVIGGCAETRFIATLPSGMSANVTYSWRVLWAEAPNGSLPLEGLGSSMRINVSTLVLPRNFFPTRPKQWTAGTPQLPDAAYTFTVEVQAMSSASSALVARAGVRVRSTNTPSLGVAIRRPRPRSVARPNVPLRLSAVVTVPPPECFPDLTRAITYVWTYEGVSRTFTSSNMSEVVSADERVWGNSSMPGKLGRELIIPQRALRLGDRRATLRIFLTDLPEVFGFAEQTISVHRSPLELRIGNGEAGITRDGGLGYTVSATGSFDPDDAFLPAELPPSTITYRWECRMGVAADAMTLDCDDGLLPRRVLPPSWSIAGEEQAVTGTASSASAGNGTDVTNSTTNDVSSAASGSVSGIAAASDNGTLYVSDTPEFNVSAAVLGEARLLLLGTSSGEDTGAPIFVRYRLMGTAGGRPWAAVEQMVQVLPADRAGGHTSVASLDGILIKAPDGSVAYHDAVEYFDDVFVVPITSEAVSWSFRLVDPPGLSKFLDNSANFVPYSGYWNVESLAPRLPLGLRAFALSPNTRYAIEVHAFSASGKTSDGFSVVQFTTVEQPRLLLEPMPVVVGDTHTLFSVSAQTNLPYNSFLFSFTYVDEDGVESSCLDCSGGNDALFRVAAPGTFTVRVRLFDARGQMLLHMADYEERLTVRLAGIGYHSTDDLFLQSVVRDHTGSSSTVTQYTTAFDDAFVAGDHAEYEYLTSVLVRGLRVEPPSGHPGSVLTEIEVVSSLVGNAAATLLAIVENTAPTTILCKNYLRIAAEMACLDSSLLADTTLYTLLRVVDGAVSATPPNEPFDVVDELSLFYNCSSSLVAEKAASLPLPVSSSESPLPLAAATAAATAAPSGTPEASFSQGAVAASAGSPNLTFSFSPGSGSPTAQPRDALSSLPPASPTPTVALPGGKNDTTGSLARLYGTPDRASAMTNLVLDVYQLQMQHLVAAASKNQPCGFVQRVSTVVVPGMTASTRVDAETIALRRMGGSANSTAVVGVTPRWLMPSERRLPSDTGTDDGSPNMAAHSEAWAHVQGRTVQHLDHMTLTVAVLCNSEQGSSLRGEDATLHWCPAVFNGTRPDMPVAAALPVGAPPPTPTPTPGVLPEATRPSLGRRRVFSLMESTDYVAMSRLYGSDAGTDTRFSLQFNVTELGADSRLAAMTWAAPLPADCFLLNTSLARRDGTPFAGCRDAVGYHLAPVKRPFATVARGDGTYVVNRSAPGATVASADDSSTVSLTTGTVGLYGVRGIHCPYGLMAIGMDLPRDIVQPSPPPDGGPPVRHRGVLVLGLLLGGLALAIVSGTVGWGGGAHGGGVDGGAETVEETVDASLDSPTIEGGAGGAPATAAPAVVVV
ncbi:hypothetical protein MMPV_001928 [Pyropia vietnamensis]